MYKYTANGILLINKIKEGFNNDDQTNDSNIFPFPYELSIPQEEEMVTRRNELLIPQEEEMVTRRNELNVPQEDEMVTKRNELNVPQEDEMVTRGKMKIPQENIVTSEMEIDINKIPEEGVGSKYVNRLCFTNPEKESDKICLDYDKIKSIYESGRNINSVIDNKINSLNSNPVYDYEMFPNSEIKNQNTLQLHDINLDDCKTICNSYIWCNSIDHHKTRNKCFLSNATIENNSNYRENVNFDHYQKKK